MKKYIPRQNYIKKVRPFINKEMIKVIVGQRRVGKSYFLYQIIDEIKKKNPEATVIYINKELYKFDRIRNYHHLIMEVKNKTINGVKNYLFIDEIQDIDQFEKALRDLQSQGNYDIYCCGSNARLMSGELASYLSGRYIEIEMFSLSYKEFLQFHGLNSNNDSLNNYLKIGGLPYLKNLPLEDDVVFDYLKNVYNTIILKDIISRYNIRNINFLENLIKYIADNVGSIVSAKKISDFLKSQKINISPNVVLNYLSYLCNACFISKVQRINIKGKKIFKIGEKYYFEDLGLRHVVKPFLLTDINKIMENIVYNHLSVSGYKVWVGKYSEKEIDFVCENKTEKIYIQTAYRIENEKTINREYGNLLALKDNYRKIVVTMDNVQSASYEGIEHMYLGDFLLNFS